jgi:hypothetical protein
MGYFFVQQIQEERKEQCIDQQKQNKGEQNLIV